MAKHGGNNVHNEGLVRTSAHEDGEAQLGTLATVAPLCVLSLHASAATALLRDL